MKLQLFSKISLLLAFVAILSGARAQTKPAPFIPEFTFQRLDNRDFSKKDLVKNRKVVFILFDVTCNHCQHEIEGIGKKYEEFKHVAIYLVSMDTKPAIMKFMSTYGKNLYGKPNVTVLHDYRPEFVQKFYPDKFPAMFIYSDKGALSKYMSGQKDIKEVIKAVK
ncbi:peroxiredoxin family protein [Pararcticibacter amylolyticus]|uniref:Thioredoxin domain-containing protein n=1 Tax=Pararcticibacter amylolyticus TaxID=2173175 RepID=A0A2U2PFR7_9SPHI|nr:redoxin domain-containing protein [Pararcticibacter amylolyticus]PWG80236.1 hypothetical protein DDR33_13675 [Pararcticibacter amylolyticus]